jgi:acyl transferase domain-containing protein
LASKFPSGLDSPASVNEQLMAGSFGVIKVPLTRWDVAHYKHAATPHCLHCAFIEGAHLFAPSFFGISAVESEAMDPQHRIVLEVGYASLHSARYHNRTLQKSSFGVFVGQATYDWLSVLTSIPSLATNTFCVTGAAPPIAANRVSFVLGLVGPSIVMDTACSSSLVSLNQGM